MDSSARGCRRTYAPLPLAGHHQSFCDQLSDGVACGHDRDAVPPGQFGEGGELVTGLVCAGGDCLAQILGNALVRRSGVRLIQRPYL
jgi:hypothetical protein